MIIEAGMPIVKTPSDITIKSRPFFSNKFVFAVSIRPPKKGGLFDHLLEREGRVARVFCGRIETPSFLVRR
jgi:hypothetical protein